LLKGTRTSGRIAALSAQGGGPRGSSSAVGLSALCDNRPAIGGGWRKPALTALVVLRRYLARILEKRTGGPDTNQDLTRAWTGIGMNHRHFIDA